MHGDLIDAFGGQFDTLLIYLKNLFEVVFYLGN